MLGRRPPDCTSHLRPDPKQAALQARLLDAAVLEAAAVVNGERAAMEAPREPEEVAAPLPSPAPLPPLAPPPPPPPPAPPPPYAPPPPFSGSTNSEASAAAAPAPDATPSADVDGGQAAQAAPPEKLKLTPEVLAPSKIQRGDYVIHKAFGIGRFEGLFKHAGSGPQTLVARGSAPDAATHTS